MLKIANLIIALRLSFLSVTILAFTFGSLIDKRSFNFVNFLLGLAAAVFTHLGCNLINDYADSKSGVDWKDKRPYQFFGGSKLIQQGALKESFYFNSALGCFILALVGVLLLSFRLNNFSPLIYHLIIMMLGWSYSYGPLRFSYRRLGELFIFLLFGPALVMGGYFIQTKIFPDLKSFLFSLPFGLLTMNILFANEIPDYPEDISGGKNTGVSFLGPQRSYLIYLIIAVAAFTAVGLNIYLGHLSKIALISFVFIPVALKAGGILRNHYNQKIELIKSSKLTIVVHTGVSIVLIAAIVL